MHDTKIMFQPMESTERNTESPEITEHPESPEIIEYVTETPKKRPPTEQITSNQNREKSVSQSEARIIRVCTPKMKASSILPRELTKTPEDVIIIDSGSVNVDSGSVNVVEEEEGENQDQIRDLTYRLACRSRVCTDLEKSWNLTLVLEFSKIANFLDFSWNFAKLMKITIGP